MNRPEYVVIAALTEDRVIGKGGELPWHIPEDLKRFKRLTEGHPIIMGRKTFESILKAIGRPLPNRHSVVLSKTEAAWSIDEVTIAYDWDEAFDVVKDESVVFIGGGESVFAESLEFADRLELTIVQGEYEGDTFFPPYEHLIGPEFKGTHIEDGDGYLFVTYERKSPK